MKVITGYYKIVAQKRGLFWRAEVYQDEKHFAVAEVWGLSEESVMTKAENAIDKRIISDKKSIRMYVPESNKITVNNIAMNDATDSRFSRGGYKNE